MTALPRVLEPGRSCSALANVDESRVIVDAQGYYRALHRAIAGARRAVLMSGWQFDYDVELLRGEEASAAIYPVSLADLLDARCRDNPELEVRILAWEPSAVYALERVWFQKQRFTWTRSNRIRFEWDRWLAPAASHHQKLVIVDGEIAFAGGMDVCHGRWDGRDHRADNPLRVSRSGNPDKPYHDVQAAVRGPAVVELERLFAERWLHATGEQLEACAPSPEPPALELLLPDALPIRAAHVAISQTSIPPHGKEGAEIRQIRELYARAIASAERLVYLENQYFTSRSITRAFVERLKRDGGSKLQLIFVLPRAGDSKKEKLALGDAQSHALGTIARAAEEHGHAFRVVNPICNGSSTPTFVHSKVLFVDDRLLSVGSANATNRSLGLDSELNLSWQAHEPETERDIARLRCSLLAEHTGKPDEMFNQIEGLCDRLDAAMRDGARLCAAEIGEPGDRDPLISLATDPERPVDAQLIETRLDEVWEELEPPPLRAAFERLASRSGKVDAPSDER